MQSFTQLLAALAHAADEAAKVEALTRYFRDATPADAAWALYLLTGRRLARSASVAELRRWAGEASGLPGWLIELSIEMAGDAAEAIALLLAASAAPGEAGPLHALIEERLLPLKELGDAKRRAAVLGLWGRLDSAGRILWNKLLGGELRGGPERGLIVRALAGVAGVSPAEMAHRLAADWPPTAAGWRHLISGDHALTSPGRPYPFLLASPLEGSPASLGPRAEWLAEWHWDGVRAQLLRRRGQVMLWTRGEELLTALCPEVAGRAAALPEGTALDGVLLAWRGGAPLPLDTLRRRLARKRPDRKLCEEIPVTFMAFDLLEAGGDDLCAAPLAGRRARLEALLEHSGEASALALSPRLEAEGWEGLEALRGEARAHGTRGLILKRLDSPYGAGRGGEWRKWPAAPQALLAVLLYAARGPGLGSGSHRQFTLGVWSAGLLVPVARAEAALPEDQLSEIEAFVRANTVERHGPVRVVRQELVFEVEYEAVQASPRHKAGLTLRAPRVVRWRRDLLPGQAGGIEGLRGVI